MIPVAWLGSIEGVLQAIIHSINYSESNRPFTMVGSEEEFGVTPKLFGGLAVDRTVFRRLLPDARWIVYAAGWVNAGDTNDATLSLVYEEDDGTVNVLGSGVATGATRQKVRLGPFDVFDTGGVPAGEDVPMVRLQAVKDTGVDGTLENWTLWLRYLPPKQ